MKNLILILCASLTLSSYSIDSRSERKKECDNDTFCSLGMSGVFGNDDNRVRVDSVEYIKYFKSVGKIEKSNGNSKNHCTGTLIDGYGQFDKRTHPNKYILTAAHCIYEPGRADLAVPNDVIFSPAFGMNSRETKIYRAEKFFVDSDYVKAKQDIENPRSISQLDWAIVKLKHKVTEVPKKERAFLKSVEEVSSLNVVSLGYPSYYNFKWNTRADALFKHEGIAIFSPDIRDINFTNEISPGQSGGPIVDQVALENKKDKKGLRPYVSSKLQIVGINTQTQSEENTITQIKHPTFNKGVRMSKELASKIRNWILKEEGML